MSSADKTKLNALHYVRSGTAVPDSSLGENGDIYILLESQEGEINGKYWRI